MSQTVRQLVPRILDRDVTSLIERQKETLRHPIACFDTSILDFLSGLSSRLLSDEATAHHADIQALGFWLRPTALMQMAGRFHVSENVHCLPMPRGLVLLIPPANVDTMFMYGLALSLLAGNATIVRLSERSGEAATALCDHLRQHLDSSPPAIRDRVAAVSFPHDDAIMTVLSQAADVRMIWGGDATVRSLRRLETAPATHDIIFADKFSWSAIKCETWLGLDDALKNRLADLYARDLFLFNQKGCASPRAHIWIGTLKQAADAARDFYPRLVEAARARRVGIDASAHIEKLGSDYLALHDMDIVQRRVYAPRLTVLTLADARKISAFKTIDYGHGLILEGTLDHLFQLTLQAERRDQTLSCFGFTEAELNDFVHACGGRGFDRIVPFGDALTFSPYWDGYDLLHELTRRTYFSYKKEV